MTVIGRGQVHVFERAVGLSGAVVRFESEVLLDAPAWLVGGAGCVDGRGAAVRAGGVRGDDRGARAPRPRGRRTRAAARSSSATCSPRCCCGSSAGTTPRTPSATTRTRSLPALRRRCSSASSPATTTPRGTRTRSPCPPPRSRARSADVTGRTTKQLDHRSRDARSGAAAAVHRADSREIAYPHRIRGPTLFLSRVQTPLR